MFVLDNIDSFARDWSLPVDEVRMWTLINEFSLHTVIGIPHVRDRLDSLVSRHAAAFRPNPSAIADKISSLEVENPADAMRSLQTVFSDPEVLLGAVRTPEQDALRPEIGRAHV